MQLMTGPVGHGSVGSYWSRCVVLSLSWILSLDLFFFFFFLIHRDPEEQIVLRQFRAGLGLMSTSSGTLYIFGRFFRYMYALKKAYTRAGRVRWVLECVTVGRGQCPHGPGDQYHGHRELSSAERLEYGLQHLNREVAIANYSLPAAEILSIFHGHAVWWIRSALPPGTELDPMWTLQPNGRVSRAFYDRFKGRINRLTARVAGPNRDGRPGEGRPSGYFQPIPVYDFTTSAEYDRRWASPLLTWNSARLGLFATGPDVPVEGTGYEHPGEYFPTDVFVRFGALQLDPVRWHEDIRNVLNGHLFPILPPRPAAAMLSSASASEPASREAGAKRPARTERAGAPGSSRAKRARVDVPFSPSSRRAPARSGQAAATRPTHTGRRRVESPRTPLLSSQGRPAQDGRVNSIFDRPGPPPFELMLPMAVPPAVLLEGDEEVEEVAEPPPVEPPSTPLIQQQRQSPSGSANPSGPDPSAVSVPPLGQSLLIVPPAVLFEGDEEVEEMAEPAMVELPSAPLVPQPRQSLSGSANPSGPDPSDVSLPPLGQPPLIVDLFSSSDESDGNAADLLVGRSFGSANLFFYFYIFLYI